MMKLTVALFATLRLHLRYLTAVTLGVLVETRIFFSLIFESSSKCPTLLYFFHFFETEVTQHCCILAFHDATESMRVENVAVVRDVT